MHDVPDEADQLYVRATDSSLRFVTGIRRDQWHNATPCTEWDVRVLVNHITSENLWIAELFSRKTMEDVGDSLDGDLLGDDPIGSYRSSIEKAKSTISRQTLDASYVLSFGEATGWEYISQIFMDQLVHGWDVAMGVGEDSQLEEELVVAAIPVAEDLVAFVGQGSVFGYKQQLGPDAAPQTRLLGIVGRREDWVPPSS